MQQTETPFLEESRLPNPDEALVKSASEGNQEAFASLFNKYHKGIYVIALKYLKDKNLAEDVLQDVFAKVWTERIKLDSNEQGPIMIENYRTGLPWKLFMSCPEVQTGLTKLGFTY